MYEDCIFVQCGTVYIYIPKKKPIL